MSLYKPTHIYIIDGIEYSVEDVMKKFPASRKMGKHLRETYKHSVTKQGTIFTHVMDTMTPVEAALSKYEQRALRLYQLKSRKQRRKHRRELVRCIDNNLPTENLYNWHDYHKAPVMRMWSTGIRT